TGKACEAVRRKDRGGRFVYDYVVMDAPPTGRITRFLNVNDEVAGLAKIGPIHNQAQAVMRVLKSPETAVHLVTLLEEMPVQETLDGLAELREAGLPTGAVVVNMVREPLFDDTPEDVGEALAAAEGDTGKLARALSLAGLGEAHRGGRAERLVEPLLERAREHTERVALERTQWAALAEAHRPLHQLRLLEEGVELAGLYRLAD